MSKRATETNLKIREAIKELPFTGKPVTILNIVEATGYSVTTVRAHIARIEYADKTELCVPFSEIGRLDRHLLTIENLYPHRHDLPATGRELAKLANVSTATLPKHLERLRHDGYLAYEIDGNGILYKTLEIFEQ